MAANQAEENTLRLRVVQWNNTNGVTRNDDLLCVFVPRHTGREGHVQMTERRRARTSCSQHSWDQTNGSSILDFGPVVMYIFHRSW